MRDRERERGCSGEKVTLNRIPGHHSHVFPRCTWVKQNISLSSLFRLTRFFFYIGLFIKMVPETDREIKGAMGQDVLLRSPSVRTSTLSDDVSVSCPSFLFHFFFFFLIILYIRKWQRQRHTRQKYLFLIHQVGIFLH